MSLVHDERFRCSVSRVVLSHGESPMLEYTDDLTIDDACTNEPEMSDADKDAFFASLEVSEPTEEELEAMAAEYEARERVDFDGYADGHRDSVYW